MVRAKIRVSGMTQYGKLGESDVKFSFSAVYKDDPNHENKQFWRYTPQMNFDMTLSREATGATEFFKRALEEGIELYLDFTEAPAPATP